MLNKINSIGAASYNPPRKNKGPTKSKSISSNSSKNQVDISDKAKKINELSSHSFINGAGEDGVITGDEMQKFIDKHTDRANTIFNKISDELGINSTEQFTIDYNPSNHRIEIKEGELEGDLKRKIEERLNNNEDFVHSFKASTSTASLLKAGKESVEFQEAYQENPRKAVAEYSWLFDAEWNFGMKYDDSSLDLAEDFNQPG